MEVYQATSAHLSFSLFMTELILLVSFRHLLFFPTLPRPAVEILCCSAKALHLPVITSHPSLLRLLGVKPSCAPCAPLPHSIPSPPLQTCGHCSNYVVCTLSFTLGVVG